MASRTAIPAKTSQRRLDRRLFVTFFSLAMLVFLASAAVVVGASWRVYEGNAETGLQAQAELTADRLAGLSPDRMVAQLQEPALAATRVTLVDGGGVVLYDSEADAATMGSHADRAEILAAREAGSAMTLRRSETTGTDTLYAAVVIRGTDCVLRLAQTRTSLPYYLTSMLIPLSLAVVLAVALSLALARIMARRIAQPLVEVDLENPLASAAYAEVEPLLERIDAQRSELLSRNRELERAVQMRREFTGNVSHEMKSPLQVIGGYAELIESGVASPEDARKFAGVIRTESQTMRTLIDDVLTLSRLDESSGPCETVFDLAAACRRAVQRRGVEATLNLPAAASVCGSEQLAEQMVYNLVDNAVRHGGGAIEVSLETAGDAWALQVSDDGPGIPREAWSRVFERFYRVDASRSRDTGGTGLGLAIVKHAAESMGGTVAVVEPRLGGATVQVILPAAQ